MKTRTRPVVLVSFLFCGTTGACSSASADVAPQHTFEINVTVDDKTFLRGRYPGDVTSAWLPGIPLRTEEGVTIAADPADPLKASLHGRIVVASGQYHTEVKELRLYRTTQVDSWRIQTEDADRIGNEFRKALMAAQEEEAKRPRPTPPPTTTPATTADSPPTVTNYWPWIAGGGIALVAVLALVVIVMRKTPETPA